MPAPAAQQTLAARSLCTSARLLGHAAAVEASAPSYTASPRRVLLFEYYNRRVLQTASLVITATIVVLVLEHGKHCVTEEHIFWWYLATARRPGVANPTQHVVP